MRRLVVPLAWALASPLMLGFGPLPVSSAAPGPDIIDTIAGGGTPTPVARPQEPAGVAVFNSRLYVADSAANVVRAIDPATNQETIVAGQPSTGGVTTDPGPALSAQFNFGSGGNIPVAIAFDAGGDLFIGDLFNGTVREVPAAGGTMFGKAMTPGNIYTVAGGLGGAGGLAVDAAGDLFIADSFNGVVLELAATSTKPPLGQSVPNMTVGSIYTVAGGGSSGQTSGVVATAASMNPTGLVFDGAGNLFLSDFTGNLVREVAAGSAGTPLGQTGSTMTAGDIYTVAGGGSSTPSSPGPAVSGQVSSPGGLARDAQGDLLISDSGDQLVREVAATGGVGFGQTMTAGSIYVVAGGGASLGDGGPALSAGLNDPTGVSLDGAGNLLIADNLNYRMREVAVQTATQFGQSMSANGIYTIAGDGLPATAAFSGGGGPALAASLVSPSAVTSDGSGDTFIADSVANILLEVPAATGTYYGQAMTAGHIYIVAGGGTNGLGDGGIATSGGLSGPQGVAVDAAGNLFIADRGNARVREVAAASGLQFGRDMTIGHIYTVAGMCCVSQPLGDGGLGTSAVVSPAGVAVDSQGNVLVADDQDNRVREIAARPGTHFGRAMMPGYIYTVAGGATNGLGDGGAATSAQLSGPTGVAVDTGGDLLVADKGDFRVREVAADNGPRFGQAMVADDIYTVAGNGTATFTVDGVAATTASVAPTAVAVDRAGDLIIADQANNRVREVAAIAGIQFGASLVVGDIYTIAGNGVAAYAGDGGAASSAQLTADGVAIDGSGNVLVVDTGNTRVRGIGATPSGPPSSFQVGLPASFHSGTPVTIKVSARDASGAVATGYRGTVHVTSTDSTAGLPADYGFTAVDGGVHSFSVTPRATQPFSLTVADTTSDLLFGTARSEPAVNSTLAGVVGGDAALYTKEGGQAYLGLGGELIATPAVVSVPDALGAPYPLFIAVGADHRLYVRGVTAGWQNMLPGLPVGCYDNAAAVVSLATDGGHTLTVACRGGDQGLYAWQMPVTAGGLPSGVAGYVSLGGLLSAGPSAAVVNGTVTFVVNGVNHQLFSRTTSAGFSPLPAKCLGHPAAAGNGAHAYIACQGLDGALYHSVTGTTTWGPFTGAGGQLIDGPGIAITSTGVSIFVEGTDQALYHTVIALDGGSATSFVPDGGRLRYGAAAVGLVTE